MARCETCGNDYDARQVSMNGTTTPSIASSARSMRWLPPATIAAFIFSVTG